MDPLDDIFAAMRVESALYARLEVTAPWGLRFAPGQTARFGLVVRGGCRLGVEGVDRPVTLAEGDCYVITRGAGYTLQDTPGSPMRDCAEVVRDRIGGVVALGGGGAAATVITGWFTFDTPSAKPLVELMPAMLHARIDQDRSRILQATLQLLALETDTPGLGSSVVISRLADIVFVQAIRAHIAAAGPEEAGWLAALSDPRIGPALRAIHADAARAWTVEALAAIAGQSRSGFALRFRQRVGEAPLAYLTRWRMFRAGCLLRQGDQSLGQIADLVGYDSEPAFAKAFKRETGLAPGAYRRLAVPPLRPPPVPAAPGFAMP